MVRRVFIATILLVSSHSGSGTAAVEEPYPETIDGELSLLIRGPGAAPFGIASAIFGSTNLAYHLGELTQAAESGPGGWEGFELGTSPLPADESYQGTLRFTLKKRSSNRWTLDHFSFDYDFVDRTSFSEDEIRIEDAMNDAGWVAWDQGVWSGPAGWQAESEPKAELRLFEAPTREDCEAGTLGQWVNRARAVIADTENWVTCYQLDLFALHPVRPSGTSVWSTPIATINVRAVNGEISFGAESIVDLEDISLPPEVGPEAKEMLEQGRQLQKWLEAGFISLDLEGDWTLDRSFSGTVSDLAISEDMPFTILTGAQARERLFVPLYAVTADPGGPYTVKRGQTLQLDGSRSKGHNLKFEWSFGPLHPKSADTPASPTSDGESNKDCVAFNELINEQDDLSSFGNEGTRKEGMRPEVVLLTPTEVILKVTDEKTGVEHVASTAATVEARDWETSFKHRTNWEFSPPGWRATWGYPLGVARNAQQKQEDPPDQDYCYIAEALQLGENWCAASHHQSSRGVDIVGVIHPHGNHFDSWLGHGYSITEVEDPDGPFDGWYFVDSTELTVDREGIFNPSVRPGGPAPPGTDENFSQANARLERDPAAIRAGVEAHEGLGSGPSASGHSLIFQDFLSVADPTREIEKRFASHKDDLQKKADKLLTAADLCMAAMSADPINLVNWTGTYWVWDNGKKEWCLVDHEI